MRRHLLMLGLVTFVIHLKMKINFILHVFGIITIRKVLFVFPFLIGKDIVSFYTLSLEETFLLASWFTVNGYYLIGRKLR